VKIDEEAYADELAAVAIERGAAQNERELADLIETLRRTRRNVRAVLEIGVYKGGTLWLWKTLWPQAEVVGIDNMTLLKCEACEHRRAHSDCPFMMFELNTHNTHLLRRDSADVPAHFRPASFDILHIDGDHTPTGVRKDWNNYTPMVRAGGLVLIHDVANEGAPGWGVHELWAETLSKMPGAYAISQPGSYGIGIVPV